MRISSIHIPPPSTTMQSLRAFQQRPVPHLPCVKMAKPLEHLQEIRQDMEHTKELLQQRQVGKSVKAAECIKAYTQALRMGEHVG